MQDLQEDALCARSEATIPSAGYAQNAHACLGQINGQPLDALQPGQIEAYQQAAQKRAMDEARRYEAEQERQREREVRAAALQVALSLNVSHGADAERVAADAAIFLAFLKGESPAEAQH